MMWAPSHRALAAMIVTPASLCQAPLRVPLEGDREEGVNKIKSFQSSWPRGLSGVAIDIWYNF